MQEQMKITGFKNVSMEVRVGGSNGYKGGQNTRAFGWVGEERQQAVDEGDETGFLVTAQRKTPKPDLDETALSTRVTSQAKQYTMR